MHRRRAEILSQGDEILLGQTLDTNAAEISQALDGLGVEVVHRGTVGDDPDAIACALLDAGSRADELVCTGGLGPTTDDWTAEAASRAFGLPLEDRADALAGVEARWRSFGRVMPLSETKQARLPRGAILLENRWGTAPGFRVDHGGTRYWFLPGVPREMREMLNAWVLPLLSVGAPPPVRLVTLRCIGLSETEVGQRLRGFDHPGMKVGYRAIPAEIQVKLRFEVDVPEVDRSRLVAGARDRIGESVFGVDSGPIEEVVGRRLGGRGETVAVAESCTGGRLAAAFTSVSGASAWFLEGVVTYANEAKVRRLGVDPEALAAHGAVSEIVARQMAEGVRVGAGATWGLSTTGIAGPTGGTPDKPVGTVFVAVASGAGTEAHRLRLPGDRDYVMARAVSRVLDLLRRTMERPGGEA